MVRPRRTPAIENGAELGFGLKCADTQLASLKRLHPSYVILEHQSIVSFKRAEGSFHPEFQMILDDSR